MMHESMDVIGPDDEIEVLGRKFEGWKKVSPSTMTFEQFVAINERPRSNAWAYESNRKGTTLITF
jgi:hypothetical protein